MILMFRNRVAIPDSAKLSMQLTLKGGLFLREENFFVRIIILGKTFLQLVKVAYCPGSRYFHCNSFAGL